MPASAGGVHLREHWSRALVLTLQAMHDFTARCLDKNANARPTAGELLKHQFLEKALDNVYLARRLLGSALQQQLRSAKSFAQSSDDDPHASEVRGVDKLAG